jgi:hypothetical protein
MGYTKPTGSGVTVTGTKVGARDVSGKPRRESYFLRGELAALTLSRDQLDFITESGHESSIKA